MGDPVRVGEVGMSGPLVRFADTRAACPYQKTAHSISCHVRISEVAATFFFQFGVPGFQTFRISGGLVSLIEFFHRIDSADNVSSLMPFVRSFLCTTAPWLLGGWWEREDNACCRVGNHEIPGGHTALEGRAIFEGDRAVGSRNGPVEVTPVPQRDAAGVHSDI